MKRHSVTVILTAPSLQTNVISRVITEQIVTQSRRLVQFSVSKWLKLTQLHRFIYTSLFDGKKQLCSKKTYEKYVRKTSLLSVNIYFCAFLNWKLFTQLLPAYNENS